ncbi:MAG: Pyruvate phosphate dikinase, partial [uncultured bacterium]
VIDVHRAVDGAVEVAVIDQQNMVLPIGTVKEQFNAKATPLDRAAVIERLRTGRKDFSGFRLSGADLSHLDLRGARFTDTLMDETNMQGARVDRLGLMDIIEGCTRVEDSNYVYIIANTMAGVDFSGADLSGLDLSGTIFHDANFTGCNLTNTNLANCDLSNAIFDYEGIQTIVEGGSTKDEYGRARLIHIKLDMDFIWDSPEKLLELLEQKVNFGTINLAIRFHQAKETHPLLKDSPLKQKIETILQKLLWEDVMKERYTTLREGRRNNVEAILPTLAAFLKRYLNFFSLKETTQLMRIYPSANVRMIEEMRELAIEISRLMDGSEGSSFRQTIHNYPSPTNLILIEEYIQKATRDPSKKEALEKLQEIQKLAQIIYGGAPDLELIKNLEKIGLSISADDFKKPDRLGKLAITLRQMYREGENFRYPIARALLAIDYSLFVLGYPDKTELYAPAQAVKIASLLKGIYGLGYGSEATLRLADIFDQLSRQDLDPIERKRAYEIFGLIALHVINEATASFHQMYDPLIASQGDLWEIPKEKQNRFANNLYRTSCLYQLNLHLQQMGIALPNSDIPQKILALLAQNVEARDFQSYFYDSDTFNADDKNFMGGKGWGLKVLAYIKKTFHAPFEVPHGFALPPLLLGESRHLLPAQQEIILSSLIELEQKTGKSFADGTLKVSVRSGALISMPGAMDTVLNVTS